jgi:hypothetical protein
MVGRFAKPRAGVCSVAQVGVGANSSPFEVSRMYTRKLIDHKEHTEGILWDYSQFFKFQKSSRVDKVICGAGESPSLVLRPQVVVVAWFIGPLGLDTTPDRRLAEFSHVEKLSLGSPGHVVG